jgi:hypothetical protein
VQAHLTVEQDAQVAHAAHLEGEEKGRPGKSSELTAAPETPSTFFIALLPPVMPANSEATAKPRKSTHTLSVNAPCIEHDSQSEEAVHPGTNFHRLAPSLQIPGPFAEDPDEAGGVMIAEDGAPAPLENFEGMKSALVAETADTEAFEPHTLAEVKHRPNWLSWETSTEDGLNTCPAPKRDC